MRDKSRKIMANGGGVNNTKIDPMRALRPYYQIAQIHVTVGRGQLGNLPARGLCHVIHDNSAVQKRTPPDNGTLT